MRTQHRPSMPSRQARRHLPTNSTAWRRIREAHLMRQPLCVQCGAAHALEVDHIDGNDANNHPGNLQTLCKACHSTKTAIENGSFGRKPGQAKRRGCDANGIPLDRNHPWRTSQS